MVKKWATPKVLLPLLQRALPWLMGLCALVWSVGLYFALVVSPADYQQGESVRIMYIHVPASWMALSVYGLVALFSFLFLVFRLPLLSYCAKTAAPIGALFTMISLVTGSIWGKPMWGTWWVWDARLTSVLVLFFIYLGYIALHHAFEREEQAHKIAAIVALMGAINLPIIKWSVTWWNTLHQPASVIRSGGPAIDPSMLTPLLMMFGAYICYFLVVWTRALTTHLQHLLRRSPAWI